MKTGVFFVSCLIGSTLALSAHAQKDIKGSGATFPSLVYSTWAFKYAKEKGIGVKYSPTGSGEGIRSIGAREVDFGATDSPLSDTETRKQKLLQFPTLVGGIVPVVNLPGVSDGQLRLSGAVLAEIFAGKIRLWNDSRIAALNPGLRLPAVKIVRVVRGDSSGTTESFVNYLLAAAPEWKIASGKKISWPGEVINATGNDGVADQIKELPGAIGYVSLDRVTKLGLTGVAMRNKAGQFIRASEEALGAAARASDLRRNLLAGVVDIDCNDCWPLADVTYILVDARPKTALEASRTLQFFYWALLNGDEIVRGTGFAPLPVEVQARVVRQLADVVPQDGKPVQLLESWRPALASLARR